MRKNKNIGFFQKTYVFFSTLKKEGIGFSLYIYTHCIFTYFLDFFSDLQFEKKTTTMPWRTSRRGKTPTSTRRQTGGTGMAPSAVAAW